MVGGPIFSWRSWPYFRLALTSADQCNGIGSEDGGEGFTGCNFRKLKPDDFKDDEVYQEDAESCIRQFCQSLPGAADFQFGSKRQRHDEHSQSRMATPIPR